MPGPSLALTGLACYVYNMPSTHVASSAAAALFAVLAMQTGTPSFEVASVKPNKGGGPTDSSTLPGGRVTMINVPLRMLIRTAYQVQDDQIVDAPEWISA